MTITIRDVRIMFGRFRSACIAYNLVEREIAPARDGKPARILTGEHLTLDEDGQRYTSPQGAWRTWAEEFGASGESRHAFRRTLRATTFLRRALGDDLFQQMIGKVAR